MHYTTTTTTLIRLHYTTTTTTLPCTRLHYTIPNYTTQHYSTVRCITLHKLHDTTTTTATAPANILITLHYSDSSTTLQLQLQLQLHYTTLHPAVVARWPLQPSQPFQKTQLRLQPPVGPSVDSLCHPWFTTTNLSYRLPIFETSATALRGTTGISIVRPLYVLFEGVADIYIYIYANRNTLYIYIYTHPSVMM